MGMGFGLNFGVWKADSGGGIAWNWVGGIFDIYGVTCRRYLRYQITKYVSSNWGFEETINWLLIFLWERFELSDALDLELWTSQMVVVTMTLRQMDLLLIAILQAPAKVPTLTAAALLSLPSPPVTAAPSCHCCLLSPRWLSR
jgi:hypothetical protein